MLTLVRRIKYDARTLAKDHPCIMIQVIPIEINALFGQLSQSMTTDSSLDCATFYK